MAFNYRFFRETRERDYGRRADLANLLGITDTYLYMLEKGMKRPSLRLVQKIAEVIKVPIEKLLREETEDAGSGTEIHDSVNTLANLRNKPTSEPCDRLKAEKHILDLEREIKHLEALIALHMRFEEIVCQKPFTADEMEKLEELAGATTEENEISFNELLAVLRVGCSTLKNWLQIGKQAYSCRFVGGGKIMASNPGVAALRLRCFDCRDFESKKCKGHGNEKRPDNVIELIDRLKANGVLSRAEQVQILGASYNLPLSLHELSEVMYRNRHGRPIPEGIYYMDNAGRRR
jgi:transcriptional regulator with XRE-family HTH domain